MAYYVRCTYYIPVMYLLTAATSSKTHNTAHLLGTCLHIYMFGLNGFFNFSKGVIRVLLCAFNASMKLFGSFTLRVYVVWCSAASAGMYGVPDHIIILFQRLFRMRGVTWDTQTRVKQQYIHLVLFGYTEISTNIRKTNRNSNKRFYLVGREVFLWAPPRLIFFFSSRAQIIHELVVHISTSI